MIIIINNYLHKSQITKNSQRWYLLERNARVFYSFLFILLLLLFFIYLHLSMFLILLVLYLYLISRLLCHVTSTPPWLLRPVKVSTSSELYPDYFRLLFLFHLPRALRFWVHIFYPQAFFTLRSSQHFWHIPNIFDTFPTFWHNLLLPRFCWESAVTFLKVAWLHTDSQNTDPANLFVWFTVIHNLLCILSLYLYMSILQTFYLWWKLW